MMTTAGAHSSQPSRRSARAPSDSFALPLPFAPAAVPTAAVWVPVLIGHFLLRGGSRDQALLLQGIADLAHHALLGAHLVDAVRRRHPVRDVDGPDLVGGRLRPTAG